MTELGAVGDSVAGEKLAAVGRKLVRVIVITGTGAHRAQRVYVWSDPAHCYVDKAIRRP